MMLAQNQYGLLLCIGTLIFVIALIFARVNRTLCYLFLAAMLSRLVVAVLQSGYNLFLPNEDALIYAQRGAVITGTHSIGSTLADVSSNQFGIIAINAWVAEFSGPVSVVVVVAIIASVASSLAVVLVVTPYMGNESESRFTDKQRRIVTIACTISPSFLFWGSQDLKEPFLMLGVAMCVYSYHVGNIGKVFFRICGILICILFRPYIGALVLGCAALITAAGPLRKRVPRAVLLGSLALALSVGITFGPRITKVDLSQQAVFSRLAGGNSTISTTLGGSRLAVPFEFFFSPVPWQIPVALQSVLPYLESLGIGILLISYFSRILTGRWYIENDGMLMTALLFCTASSIYAAGLANSGTLSRERSPFLLCMLPLIIRALGSKAPRSTSSPMKWDMRPAQNHRGATYLRTPPEAINAILATGTT